MEGLRPKGHAGTAEHPVMMSRPESLEVKNLLTSPGEEEDIYIYVFCFNLSNKATL